MTRRFLRGTIGSMTLEIRNALPADLDAVYLLETQGFVPGIRETREVFESRILQFPQGFFLALHREKPVGYFCCEIWKTSDLWRSEPHCFDLGHDLGCYLDVQGECLYIASMTVSDEVRGKGLGSALFQQAVDRMRTDYPLLKSALLIVNEHWPAAQGIYRREGFTIRDRLEAFFTPINQPVGAALVMEKTF